MRGIEEKYTNNIPLPEAIELRRRFSRREVRVEWGAFLEDMGPWEVFMAQTPPWRWGRPLVEDFVERLFAVTCPGRAFIVAERARGSIGPHIHALLGKISIKLPNGGDNLNALRKHSWKRWLMMTDVDCSLRMNKPVSHLPNVSNIFRPVGYITL